MLRRILGVGALLLLLLGLSGTSAKADVGITLNFGMQGFGLAFVDRGQGEVPFIYEEEPDYYFYPRYFPPCNCTVMVRPAFEYGDWAWYDQYGNVLHYGPWNPPETRYYQTFRMPYGFFAYYDRGWGEYRRPWNCRNDCGDNRHDWDNWRRQRRYNDDNQRRFWDNNSNGYRTWSNQRHDDFVPFGADRHQDWKKHNQWQRNGQNGNDRNNNQGSGNWQNNNRQWNENQNNGNWPRNDQYKKPDKHPGQEQYVSPPKHDNRQKNWQGNNNGNYGGSFNQNRVNNDHGKPDHNKPRVDQPPPPQDNNNCSAKAHAKGKC